MLKSITEQPLLPLAYLLGISAPLCLAVCPPWLPTLLGCIIILVIATRFPSSYRLFSLGFGCGLVWMLFCVSQHQASLLPPALENQPITIQGKICSIPAVKGKTVSFVFETNNVIHPTIKWQGTKRLKLSWKTNPNLPQVGHHYTLVVQLKRPRSYANPGSFDSERYFFAARIQAQGWVRQQLAMPPVPPTRYGVRGQVPRLARAFAAFSQGGVMLALATGDKHAIPKQTWAPLQATGTSHLVAISGLHFGLVGFGLAKLAELGYRMLLCRRQSRSYKGWFIGFGILIATVYAGLAGWGISVTRAWSMSLLAGTALGMRRCLPKWHIFNGALVVMLTLDPFIVLSAGFWLSFYSVLVLLWCQTRTQPGWQAVRSQCQLSVALLPLSVQCFNQVTLLAPLANLVAIPWASVTAVPCVLLGTLLTLVQWPGAQLCLQAANSSLELMMQGLNYLARTPGYFSWPAPMPLCSAIAAGSVLISLGPKGLPGRKLAWLAWVPLVWPAGPRLQSGQCRLTVLDLGQGLGMLVQTAKHTLLFDTGPKYGNRFDAGAQIVVPYCRHMGIRRLDKIIVSHGDNDHAGGLKSVQAHLAATEILSGEPKRLLAVNSKACRAGQAWRWDGVQFNMLAPLSSPRVRRKANNASCVLQIIAGDHRILLTGDIEKSVERQLQRRYGAALASDVLQVPHHGSTSSSSWAFVKQVAPTFALISAGYQNRYGHPRAQVLQRYSRLRSNIINTAQYGATSIKLGSKIKTLQADCYRIKQRKFWREPVHGLDK